MFAERQSCIDTRVFNILIFSCMYQTNKNLCVLRLLIIHLKYDFYNLFRCLHCIAFPTIELRCFHRINENMDAANDLRKEEVENFRGKYISLALEVINR